MSQGEADKWVKLCLRHNRPRQWLAELNQYLFLAIKSFKIFPSSWLLCQMLPIVDTLLSRITRTMITSYHQNHGVWWSNRQGVVLVKKTKRQSHSLDDRQSPPSQEQRICNKTHVQGEGWVYSSPSMIINKIGSRCRHCFFSCLRLSKQSSRTTLIVHSLHWKSDEL